MATPAVRSASIADWAAIKCLLQSNQLPLQGAKQHLGTYVVAMHDGEIVATAGLEVCSEVGLLRSVAVKPTQQGQGLGQLVVDAVRQEAIERRLVALYLLTNTAADYFAARGFVRVSRAYTPTALLASEEFCGACPASATLMVWSLSRKAITIPSISA